MQHRVPLAPGRRARSESYGVIVHSHLRWDFVWQRPQQILSRLARTNPVLFVEEPILLDDIEHPTLDLMTPVDRVTRAVPRIPRGNGASYDEAMAMIRTLIDRARRSPLIDGRFNKVVQWFYTPMPAPEMIGAFGENAVVYDCLDEPSRFRSPPSDLARRERLLLSRADVVFARLERLFEAKSRYHHNVHFIADACEPPIESARHARAPDESRAEEGLVPAAARSWDPIVRRMRQLIMTAVAARGAARDVNEILSAGLPHGAQPEAAGDPP